MPEWTAIISGRDALTLLKEHRAAHRGLQVRLRPRGAGRRADRAGGPYGWVDFPPERESLHLEGLRPGLEYELVCRRQGILQRLRHPAQRRTLRLAPRPLRLLLTGSGRCGTQTIASYLDGMRFADGERVRALHEPLSEHVVPALLEGRLDLARAVQEGLGHNVESAPYYALFPEAIAAERVIHLIRDGRRVVQSGLNRGWYQNDSMWNRIKPDFAGDAFARCCHYWRLSCEQAASAAERTFRLEDLSGDPAVRGEFLALAGIVDDGRPLPHRNRGRVPASHTAWGEDRREAFAAIAGGVMDRYYPGWRSDGNRPAGG